RVGQYGVRRTNQNLQDLGSNRVRTDAVLEVGVGDVINHVPPQIVLLEVREQCHEQAIPPVRVRRRRPAEILLARDVDGWRKPIVRVVEVVGRQADLLEVVLALQAIGSLPDLLDGREQEANEDCNNGDDDEQLNKCESAA